MPKEIQLTRGKVSIVDDEDFGWISQWNWFCDAKGYAKRKVRKSDPCFGKRSHILLHREITNAPDGLEVDHINGNRLDNRRTNLRVCKHIENSRNLPARANARSKYKGVHWVERDKRWRVIFRYQRVIVFQKEFRTELEGAVAYDILARKYYGEFARLNFPDAGVGGVSL